MVLEVTEKDNPTEITRPDIDIVIRQLVNANSQMVSDSIEGENKFGTGPVREAYWAMVNSRIIPDLEAVQGFISKAQYPSQMSLMSAEWGSISNLRFLVSSMGSISPLASGLGADVMNMFVTGLDNLAGIKSSLIDSDLLAA